MTTRRAIGIAAVLVGMVGAAGCARDVRTHLPSAPDDLTGSIEILLTQPARDLTVTINGVLVAERRRTEKVRIDRVPVGYADVMIAAGSGQTRVDLHIRVSIDTNTVTTIPVAAPDSPFSSAVSMGILSVAAWLLSRAIYLAFFE